MEDSKSSTFIGNEFRLIHEALESVTDYVDRFYDPVRRHSALGYISPQQFEDWKLFQIHQASLSAFVEAIRRSLTLFERSEWANDELATKKA